MSKEKRGQIYFKEKRGQIYFCPSANMYAFAGEK
jgi:hypothetical protein